jgi:hypothetical protein
MAQSRELINTRLLPQSQAHVLVLTDLVAERK